MAEPTKTYGVDTLRPGGRWECEFRFIVTQADAEAVALQVAEEGGQANVWYGGDCVFAARLGDDGKVVVAADPTQPWP